MLKLRKQNNTWYMHGVVDGRQVTWTTRIRTDEPDSRQKAEAVLAGQLKSLQKPDKPEAAPAPKPNMTLSQVVDRYLKGKTPARLVQVRYLFRFYPEDISIEDAARQVDDYRIWLTENGYAEGTIAAMLNNALTVFNFARKNNLLDTLVSVDKPRVRQPIKAVPDDELKRFMKALDGWPKLMATFILNTGLRKSELLDLKVRDIDLNRKQAVIRDTKNGEDRYIPLNDAAMKVLRKAIPERQADDTVFPNIDLNFQFKRASEKAKINHVHPHMLRHTFATLLAQSGVNLEVIRALGGWKRLDMAARYAKADLRAQHAGASLISDDDF